MHLTDLCHDLIEIPDQAGAIMVTGLAVDSKRVAAGDLFFALAGTHRDGRDFIGDAIKAGAAAIVTAHVATGKRYCQAGATGRDSDPAMRKPTPRYGQNGRNSLVVTTWHGCRCYRHKWQNIYHRIFAPAMAARHMAGHCGWHAWHHRHRYDQI